MKHVYVLEGPDGAGKTVLGAQLASRLKVPVTNHGPYKGETYIWRHYFNSMLPAYSGERDVILDRCWLAEPIYGEVFRGGMNRLEGWQRRILEYVAAESNARFIICLPPFMQCLRAFNSRRDQEMLENDKQLKEVYDLYEMLAHHLVGQPLYPTMIWDWTVPNQEIHDLLSRMWT